MRMGKKLILILIFGLINSSLIATALQSRAEDSKVKIRPINSKILKQINKINDDGSYTFGYEADDGSFKVETRSKDGVVKGKYGFIDPNGELKTVEYSAGLKPSTKVKGNLRDTQLASATETEPKKIKMDSRENSAESGSSSENNSGGTTTSGENSSSEDDPPAFNSFSNPVDQKNAGQPSELTKRQGQLLNGGPNDGTGLGIRSQYAGQYAGQGQGIQGNQLGYIPETQLQGGQFHGGFVDPRTQGFRPIQQQPQFYQGQGIQPQLISSNLGPRQQFTSDGFGLGGGPQSHYIGRQYSQQPFIGGSPTQFGSVQSDNIGSQFIPQNQIQSQEENGFVRGIPPNYFGGPRSQQFEYNNGPQSPRGIIGFGRPGFQQNTPYQQFPTSGGIGVGQSGQFGQSGLNRFSNSALPTTSSTRRPFNNGDISDQTDYVPNPEIDGFSEDNDQDGFVDTYPGSDGSSGKSAEATDEKTPSLKTPNGEKVQGQYTPQILGPSQVLQGRPGFNQISNNLGNGSPYNDQELQQIYPQSGIGHRNLQNPYSYTDQFQLSDRRPQFQSYPVVQQEFSPQSLPFGNPQYISQGQRQGPQQFLPGRGQYNGGQFQGQRFLTQFPLQPQQYVPQGQVVQGQLSPGTINPQQQQQQFPDQSQYINGQGSPGGQFPYDYVGGVGPNGFPLGGPQTQYLQQKQGPSPGPAIQLSPTPGALQVVTSDSNKTIN